MKKLFLLITFLITFINLFINIKPSSSNAAGLCGLINAQVSTDPNFLYQINITGAAEDYFGKTVNLDIYNPDTNSVIYGTLVRIDNQGNSNLISIAKTAFPKIGNYPVRLSTQESADCANNRLTLNVTENLLSSPERPGPKTCGVDKYLNLNTFCSQSLLSNGRIQVLNYSGCRVTEYCVADLSTAKKETDITQICSSGKQGINTAIGCIPIEDSNELISFFLRWGLGIAGGIAFLLILVAGFQIMTSRGDPNRLKAGQELLTSAIAGIILLIFSIVILRFIGVNILNIKGFGSPTP